MSTTTTPKAGDMHAFHVLHNYHPNVFCRGPWAEVEFKNGCGCADRKHAFYETVHVEEVRETIFWADNSVEVFSVSGRIDRLAPPSGDLCY